MNDILYDSNILITHVTVLIMDRAMDAEHIN